MPEPMEQDQFRIKKFTVVFFLTAMAPVDPLAALSARERQVVDAILAGHSAKQAGRALGLSPTSVATYRQRAFAKLGVRRQVELFGLLSRGY